MRTHHLLKLLLVVSLLSICMVSEAQIGDSVVSSIIYLPEIIVSEKRLDPNVEGRSYDVITAEQIAQLPVQSVPDLLTYLSGIDLNQRGPNGTQADLSIDGSGFEQNLVMINGVPLRDPQTGHHILNLPVSLLQIDRIEIIHGAAGRIYGSNALAGTINIITRRPKENEVIFDLQQALANPDSLHSHPLYHFTDANLLLGFRHHQYSHQISLSAQVGNGYRPESADDQWKASYEFACSGPANSEWHAMAAHFRNHFGASYFYAYPYDTRAEESVNTSLLSLSTSFPHNKWLFRPSVYFRYNEDHYVFDRLDPSLYQNFHYSGVLGAEFQSSWENRIGQLGLGVDARNEYIHSSNLGDHHRTYANAFAEQRWIYGKYSSTLTAGIQFQYADHLPNLFPGIEWNQIFAKRWNAFANLGLSNRLPSYTELYYSDRANQSNDSLRNENARFAQLGVQKLGALSFEVSGFYRSVINQINYIRYDAQDMWTPLNSDQVDVAGWHARLQYIFCQWSYANIDYTYLHPQLQNPQLALYKYQYDQARHRLQLQWNMKFGKHFNQNIAFRFVDRLQGNHYALLDYQANIPINDHLKFRLGVTNILNTQYYDRYYLPMPGRWFQIGFRGNW